jgi:hypothetical protein
MRNLNTFFSSGLTKKNSLILILTFTVIVILDLTVVKFASYTGQQLPTSWNVQIFIAFSFVFSIISILFLYMTRKTSESVYTLPINIKYLRGFFFFSQTTTISIISIIILQMILSNKYNIILVRAETYLAYISTLIFLIFLVFLFIGWFKSKRNYIIMLFTISFSLLIINLVISLIYLDSYFSSSVKQTIQPYQITSFVTNFGGSSFHQQIAFTHDMLSILSFSFMWIATAILLSQYRYKIGKIKYFILVSIPLIYYIFPFEGYFGNIFFSLILDYPITFAIIYILIFSATKQIGALFFSIFFLIASILVAKSKVRQSILFSAIGMVIIFGSLDIATLQYSVYPPFGLITTAFMPLGSYLLFIGILSSAQNISRNIQIRKEVYKSANSQFDLLKIIGMAQMEKELLKKYKSISKYTSMSEEEVDKLDQDEISEIVHDVVNELLTTKKIRKS